MILANEFAQVEVTLDETGNGPRLRVVGRHGAGLDIVDIPAATRLGVAVVHAPGANAQAVAEHALMLMLMCARRAVQVDRWTRDGDWRAAYAIYDIQTQTISIRRLEYDIETAQRKIREAGLPTDWPAFRRYYSQIRKKGYYFSNGELETNLAALAVPLHQTDGSVVAALSLVTTVQRMAVIDLDKLTPLIQRAAQVCQPQIIDGRKADI